MLITSATSLGKVLDTRLKTSLTSVGPVIIACVKASWSVLNIFSKLCEMDHDLNHVIIFAHNANGLSSLFQASRPTNDSSIMRRTISYTPKEWPKRLCSAV